MEKEVTIGELLRWRLARAEAEAPPAPRAARLLELARPWWETWPERFRSPVEQLGKIQVAYGHAMAEPRNTHNGHPVAAIVVRTLGEVETSARVLYLDVRASRLRLRFQLDSAVGQGEECFEVTFISDANAELLFSAQAARSLESEYRLDAELPEELRRHWEQLKVTNRMPFRLILSPQPKGG